MPALVFAQTTRFKGTKPSFAAAECTGNGEGHRPQQSSKNHWICRVAAHNTMRTETEKFADPGDRGRAGFRLEGPLLEALSPESQRMTWSISDGGNPVISIGASSRINSSNSIFNASRFHSPFSARRLTASLSTRCSSGFRWPMRMQGSRSKPNCCRARLSSGQYVLSCGSHQLGRLGTSVID